MDALRPVLFLVVGVALVACWVIGRRRLVGDLPLLLAAAIVAGLGTAGIVLEGVTGALCGLAGIGLGLALDFGARGADVAELARVRGQYRLAAALAIAAWVAHPNLQAWTRLATFRILARRLRGDLDDEQALAALDGRLTALLGHQHPGNRGYLDRTATVVAAAVEEVGVDRLPDARFYRWLLDGTVVVLPWHGPAYVRAVERACVRGWIDAAATLVERLSTVESDDDVFRAHRTKARIHLLAAAGQREPVRAALAGGSPYRFLFVGNDRERLLSLDPAAEPSPGAQRLVERTAHRLEGETRWATGLTSVWPPLATRTLLAVLVVAFVAQRSFGPALDPLRLEALGASTWSTVVQQGELWRLVTAMFLHAGVLHAGLNAAFLWYLAPSLERLVGPTRVAAIYLAGGIGGGWAAMAMAGDMPHLPMVGASGAIFGLFGAMLLAVWRLRDEHAATWRASQLFTLALIAALNLYIGVAVEFVSFAAHAGGAVAGALMLWAMLLDPEPRARPLARALTAAAWLGAALVAVVGLATQRHTLRAERALAGHRPVQALEAYDAALVADPASRVDLLRRASLRWELGRLDDALSDADRLVALYPRDAYAHTVRASMLLDAGRAGDALAAADRALAVEPESFPALSVRLDAHLHRAELKRALEDLDQLLALSPGDPELRVRRSGVLMYAGRYEDALADLDASSVMSGSTLWQMRRAEILVAMGDRAGAAPYLEAATAAYEAELTAHPNTVWAATNLGWVDAVAGRYDACVTHSRQAATLAPDSVTPRYNLGYCHLLAGRPEQARNAYVRALDVGPSGLAVLELAALRERRDVAPDANAILSDVFGR